MAIGQVLISVTQVERCSVDGWLTSTSYERQFDGEGMAQQDKVRPLTDCSSTLA